MSIERRRLPADELRQMALDAARALLIEAGPPGVTLKAVATRIGRTHANLLHHFGSAADLQKALAARMATDITASIAAAVVRLRSGEQDARAVVDLTYDAFDREGAGQLASWMILTGNEDALDPVLDAIHRLVDAIDTGDGRPVAEITLSLVTSALGDALLGGAMARALGLPRQAGRAQAARALERQAGIDA